MNVMSLRFGQLEVPDDLVLQFNAPIPGFEQDRRFVLLSPTETRPLQWLQSVEDANLCFPAIEPAWLGVPYDIEIPIFDVRELQLTRGEEATVLCLVVLSARAEALRLNLRAPIVCNLAKGLARQIVLSDTDYPVQFTPRLQTQPAERKEAVCAGA